MYENPQDTQVILDEHEDSPQERLARDLAAGVEASPGPKQTGQEAADAVAPDQEKLDEGDLEDYDQETLAEDREKD